MKTVITAILTTMFAPEEEMKRTTKKALLLGSYAGLCLVFWLPYLKCYLTHGPLVDAFGRPRIWAVLIAPSAPLALFFREIPMPDILALIGQPLYLAAIFWPLLALGLKPERWQQERWNTLIVWYSICLGIVLFIAAAFTILALSIGPC